jgi:transmembrane sensor
MRNMNNDIEHQKEIARSLIEDIQEMELIDKKKDFSQVKSKKTILHLRKVNRYIIRYAAILFLPLLISAITFGVLYYHVISAPVQYVEVKTSSGTVLRYELPDKSVVWLNSNSKLRYPVRFTGDKREVSLEGEGYFQVKADKKHPFYVNTPHNFKVFVYGTHFDVNAYSDDPTIKTTLEEGKVNVITPDRRMAQLSPGEEISYNKSTEKMYKENVDVYEKTAWIEGKLVFRDVALEDVFKQLSRHFNVKIHFNNLSGRVYHYHATFTDETLSQILDYLSESANLKWKIEKPYQKDDSSFTQNIVYVTLH